MAKIQFSLIIKIKIGRPEHLLTHNPPRVPQSGRHMCITPYLRIQPEQEKKTNTSKST